MKRSHDTWKSFQVIRPKATFNWAFLIFAGIWIIFLLYLDFKYDKFPTVFFGGIQILCFLYFLGIISKRALRGIRGCIAKLKC